MSHFDNAATSWPKPAMVTGVVNDYLQRLGVSVGRGGYAEADEVEKAVERTRTEVNAARLSRKSFTRQTFGLRDAGGS